MKLAGKVALITGGAGGMGQNEAMTGLSMISTGNSAREASML
jgi:hypothetical protein